MDQRMLLALGFAAPWMLLGLLFAAVPAIIHWLFRRRFQETPWAAMQFLLAAAKQQTRWNRLDQLLLLAVRTLIPLAAALALAVPTWQLAASGLSQAPVRRILVLDASLSLSALENQRSRFAAVKERALSLVEDSRPGDAWQLVRMADSPPRAVITQPALQTEAVVEEIQQLVPSFERGDVAAALETTLAVLDQPEDGRRREVHILTDAQRSNWRPAEEVQQARIQSLLATVGSRSRVVWTDVTAASVDNAAVVDLTLDQPYVYVGQPIRATATVRQLGNAASEPRTVEWRVDGRMVARQTVDLSEQESRTLSWSYVPTTVGDLRIQVDLNPDALAADDRRRIVCPVREAVRVLLVDGRRSGMPFENATDALRLALAPEMDRSTEAIEPSRVLPTVIGDGELLNTELSRFDVVVLCDAPLIAPRDAEVLKRYVSAGGSLVIAAGPRLNPESYNTQLSGDETGLLPARWGEIIGDAAHRESAYLFEGGDFAHPILSPFRGNPNTGFELTRTFAYRKLKPAADAEVCLKFDTGDPAIVERSFGYGRVLQIATAVDRSWSTWAVWGHTFVPMMHETIRYLVAFRMRDRTVRVGQPLVYRSISGSSASWTVRRPDDTRESIATRGKEGTVVLYESTAEPGFYGIEPASASTSTTWFAVNADPQESDLRPLTATELRDGLFGGQTYDEDVASSMPTEAAAIDDDRSLARWLLGCMIVFLVCEPFLAWNRQLAGVVAVLLAATAVLGWLWGSWAAVTTAVIGVSITGWWLSERTAVVPGS